MSVSFNKYFAVLLKWESYLSMKIVKFIEAIGINDRSIVYSLIKKIGRFRILFLQLIKRNKAYRLYRLKLLLEVAHVLSNILKSRSVKYCISGSVAYWAYGDRKRIEYHSDIDFVVFDANLKALNQEIEKQEWHSVFKESGLKIYTSEPSISICVFNWQYHEGEYINHYGDHTLKTSVQNSQPVCMELFDRDYDFASIGLIRDIFPVIVNPRSQLMANEIL